MAQDPSNSGGASYTLDDVTFPVGRSKLQSIFNAVRSTNKGSSAPDLVAGQFWIDDSGGSSWIMYFYDGSNNIQFATIDTSANTVNFTDSAFDLIVDTTPQLGGNLDVNGNAIVSASNGNITITPNGSGKVILDGISHPTADGSNGQVLTTNGAGVLSFTDKTVDTTNLVADTSPQLGGDLDLNSNDITGTGNINFTGNVVLTGTVDGRDIAADGAKLDGVEASATADQTASEIRTLVDTATDSNVFTDADHTKLNAIEASATADQTDAEIRAAVESATDSNVFTDADHTKLNGIETGATADQTNAEIKTAVEAESDIALAGNPTTTTQTAGNNSTRIATTAFVQTATAAIVDSAPGTLDTLNELAAALGDDANFSTTVSNNIATKLPLAGGTMTGNIVMNSTETVDGRDLSVDGAKLDGIEASATADQTAAEIRTLVDSATDSNVFTDADHTKLNAIEASADVTDTANVTAAGALMDSEVTNLADVKSFDTADYATAAQGTLATNALPKSGGTMTGATIHGDNVKSQYGDSNDLEIFHNGVDSVIKDAGTGSLEIRATDLKLNTSNNSQNMIKAIDGGAVELYHNGSKKVETASGGIDVTGNIVVSGTVDGRDLQTDGTKLDGIEAGADVTDATNVDAAGAIMNSDVATKGQLIVGDGSGDPTILSVGADGLYLKADSTASSGVAWASVSGGGGGSAGGANEINMNDDVAVNFGAGDDLEIFHESANNRSIIKESGTGDLHIRANDLYLKSTDNTNTYAYFVSGGASALYHNNNVRFTTSSSGFGGSGDTFTFSTGGTEFGRIENDSNDMYIRSMVSDKDIQFRGNDGGTEIVALTLDMSSNGKAIFNNDAAFGDTQKAVFGNSEDLQIYHDGNDSYVTDQGAGTLIIRGSNQVRITNTGGDNMIVGNDGGGVELYHNATKVIETTADGLDMPDSKKLQLGDGDDLQFFHDTVNSQIISNTGELKIRSDNLRLKNLADDEILAEFTNGSSCDFYFNNVKMARTTSDGFQIEADKRLEIVNGSNWSGEVVGKIEHHSNSMYHQYNTSFITRNSSGTNTLTIDSSGNATFNGNVTAFSDIRLKEDVKTIDNALDKVTKLRGVEYTRKETKSREIGVIAQEVKEIVPELVNIENIKSDINPDDFKDMHVMKYGNTVGLLIEAIKELKAEIEELKKDK